MILQMCRNKVLSSCNLTLWLLYSMSQHKHASTFFTTLSACVVICRELWICIPSILLRALLFIIYFLLAFYLSKCNTLHLRIRLHLPFLHPHHQQLYFLVNRFSNSHSFCVISKLIGLVSFPFKLFICITNSKAPSANTYETTTLEQLLPVLLFTQPCFLYFHFH